MFNEVYVHDLPHVLISTKVEVMRNYSQKFQFWTVLITHNKIFQGSFFILLFRLGRVSTPRYFVCLTSMSPCSRLIAEINFQILG